MVIKCGVGMFNKMTYLKEKGIYPMNTKVILKPKMPPYNYIIEKLPEESFDSRDLEGRHA